MKRILFAISLLVMASGNVFAQTAGEADLDLQYATELLTKGTQAPDFTLNDINGKPVSLSDFVGRKVVLQFWASWCPDCRAAVPQMQAMQAAADPSEVAFVSISFDRTFEAFKTYVSENYLGGVQLFDPAGKKESEVGAAYHIKWIPSLYLIDEQGKVVFGTVVADKIAKALNADTHTALPGRGVCTEEGCSL